MISWYVRSVSVPQSIFLRAAEGRTFLLDFFRSEFWRPPQSLDVWYNQGKEFSESGEGDTFG